MDEKRHMLRHFLGALAYRTQKALKDAPEGFFSFRALKGVRTPHELIRHMTGVLGYARTFMTSEDSYEAPVYEDPRKQITFFHDMLESVKECLEGELRFRGTTPEQILQGPFSDAMSHAGQLAMLRRFFGQPVPPENFIVASISHENLGEAQSAPVSPDVEWFDAEGVKQVAPNH